MSKTGIKNGLMHSTAVLHVHSKKPYTSTVCMSHMSFPKVEGFVFFIKKNRQKLN